MNSDESVFFLIPSLRAGGAERVVSIVASNLAKEGKRVFMKSKKTLINEDIRRILSYLPKNKKYYEMYGKMLASNKSPLGVSKKYLEKFLNI